MNIELKPIAESKVRQLGGDVCGVLVRTEGEVMAVSEHGRCTRLDAGVMGPIEPGGMSDMRDEFEKWVELHIGWNDPELKRDNDDPDMYLMDITQYAWSAWQAARALPEPTSAGAVPEGWKLVPIEPTDGMIQAGIGADNDSFPLHHIYKAMLAAAPQPPNEGYGDE